MTKIFTGGRASGKTTAAIKEASKHNLYILVTTRQQAAYVAMRAREMDLKIPYPISIDELEKTNLSKSSIIRDGIIVEEAQSILEKLIGTRIRMMTATESDEF